MVKLNKKGFMMAELVVVSAIVLVTLVSLYSSYNKIYSIYKSRVGYYDVATLYRLGYYRDILNEYELLDDAKNKAKENRITTIYSKQQANGIVLEWSAGENPNEDNVFLIYNNKSSIDSTVFNGKSNINRTFKDYVDFLEDSIDFSEFEYMLIMERCNLDGTSVDINSCNYAYLEVLPESNNNNNNGEDKIIVKYDANGGIDKGISQQEKNAGALLRLKDEIPTREGYTFVGWGTSASATSKSYDAGGTYTADVSITLYAVWESNVVSPINSYSCKNKKVGSSPYLMTYTGNCTVIDDGSGNWRVKFLTTGTLKFSSAVSIDAFLVGGGGGGGVYYGAPGGGGGGGYTTLKSNISLTANQNYKITIGAGGAAATDANHGTGGRGGTTSAFSTNAAGGYGNGGGGYGVGHNKGGDGGSGGGSGHGNGIDGTYNFSGGKGGSYGGNGQGGYPGSGQGRTTCEFEQGNTSRCNSGVSAYSPGGGGGGTWYGEVSSKGSGLTGANSGAGGSSAGPGGQAQAGSSGIVIIRNKR